MSNRRRSGPRRRLDVLGAVGRAKLRDAILRALAEANGDYDVVAGLFGLPLSAVYALVEESADDDGVIEELIEPPLTKKRSG
jgi:hypothetical protein